MGRDIGMNFQLLINGIEVKGALETHASKHIVTVGTERHEVVSRLVDDHTLLIAVGDRQSCLYWARAGKKLYLAQGSRVYEVEEIKESTQRGVADHLVDNTIIAPMPGLVVKVNCQAGDVVEKGQILVIVEAMKMENQLRAPLTGKVKCVTCKGGDRVAANQVLVELENG